ncbi:MAG: polysaccharide deacetylase family protein [Eggerthellaceae bacterium]|nr:polysaccharide deacetylase family protein [Eggerthellaceae bacterium]
MIGVSRIMSYEDEFAKYSRASYNAGRTKNGAGVDLPGIKPVVPISKQKDSRKEKFYSMRIDDSLLRFEFGRTSSKYSHSHAATETVRGEVYNSSTKKRKQKKPRGAVAAIICAFFVIGIGVGAWLLFIKPVNVTINYVDLIEVDGNKDVARALEISNTNTIPGDFVAVDGEVLEKNKGDEFAAEINGIRITDIHWRLCDGDEIKIVKGDNKVEEFTSYEIKTPFSVSITGSGPIHEVKGNALEGITTVKKGKISGNVSEEQTQEVSNVILDEHLPDTGSDKVIALTFDDGPTEAYTPQILDILEANDVKATFFTIGNQIQGNEKILKRAYNDGDQICTHSYTHGKGLTENGDGLDLNSLTAEEQHKEIELGLKAIETATGEPASRILRAPGGSFTLNILKNIADLNIRGEIGWTIDSKDWKLPSVRKLIKTFESATPGDIILCHDGGGDRTNTIEALKTAIPSLKQQGYKFVTIDELMQYPAAHDYLGSSSKYKSGFAYISNSRHTSGC